MFHRVEKRCVKQMKLGKVTTQETYRTTTSIGDVFKAEPRHTGAVKVDDAHTLPDVGSSV